MMDVRRIPIADFRALGYLQEANRQFFHPLGLALEVQIDADGTERLGGVWDYRDDPEGIAYGDDILRDPKYRTRAAAIVAEQVRRAPERQRRLGFWIQGTEDCP